MDSTSMGSPPADDEMLSQARQGYADFLAEQARFQEAYDELALVNAGVPALAKR